ncbi:MAG: sugar phosphate nucleotidyltransferase [Vampirovibrionales bacterium]
MRPISMARVPFGSPFLASHVQSPSSQRFGNVLQAPIQDDFAVHSTLINKIPVETLAGEVKKLKANTQLPDPKGDKLDIYGLVTGEPGQVKKIGTVTHPEGLPKTFAVVQAKGDGNTSVRFRSPNDPHVHYFMLPGSKAWFKKTGTEVEMHRVKQSNFILESGALTGTQTHKLHTHGKPLNATVLVLGAGLSSRFYPFTPTIGSKTAAPVQPGLSIPGAVMTELAQQGASDFVTHLHFKADQTLKGIEQSFETLAKAQQKLDQPVSKVNAFYVKDNGLPGTAGTVLTVLEDGYKTANPMKPFPHSDAASSPAEAKAAVETFKSKLHTRPLLVIQGDAMVKGIDFHKVLEAHNKAHKEHGALVTIVSMKPEDSTILPNFGCIKSSEANHSGIIKKFVEKPKDLSVLKDEDPSKPMHQLVNTGIYVIDPKAFDLIKERSKQPLTDPKAGVDFGNDVFPYLVEKGYPLYTHVAEGVWSDVGNLHAYHNGLKHRDNYIETLPEGNPFKSMGSMMRQGTIAVTPDANQAFKLDKPEVLVEGNVLVARALPEKPYDKAI